MAKTAGSGNAADLIRQVIAEMDAQISELTSQRAQLERMVSGNTTPAVRRRGRPPASVASAAKPAKKRKVSAATKAKLKSAAKARWARYRAEKKGA